MGDEQTAPDRVGAETAFIPVPGPIPVAVPAPGGAGLPTFGVEMDNVHKSETPSGLVPQAGQRGVTTEGGGAPAVKTEWDAASLDKAIEWLESHASYLNRLSYQMVDLKDLMGGATPGVGGAKSPLGGFSWAQTLTGKHNGLYTSTEAAVKKLSTDLENAAEALKNVKENYERAEERNAMSASDMQKAFPPQGR